MSFIAKITIDGEELNVLHCGFRFTQVTDATGKPTSVPQGGNINLVLESNGSTNLFDWMISPTQTKSGVITFYRRDSMSKLKTVEFGDAQLDTWLFWVDVLQFLGEFESAIQTLLQASEFFPDDYQIEYRLAGLYFTQTEDKKGTFHLSNALRLNFKNRTILEELFPAVWDRKKVQNYIKKYDI